MLTAHGDRVWEAESALEFLCPSNDSAAKLQAIPTSCCELSRFIDLTILSNQSITTAASFRRMLGSAAANLRAVPSNKESQSASDQVGYGPGFSEG